jgi:hypothetical protein
MRHPLHTVETVYIHISVEESGKPTPFLPGGFNFRNWC